MARKTEESGLLEFTARREDFLAELALVKDGAEKKATLPILGMVLLEAAGDQVTLTASDLELVIQSTFPAKVKREGAGTLPAKKLHDYVKLLPDGDVRCAVQDANWAGFTGGKNRARIAGMAREHFPEVPAVPDLFVSLPVKALALMIARVQFAISQEESRFTLNAALLLLDWNSMTLVATDGHRLAFTQTIVRDAEWGNEGEKPLKLLLPKRAMSEIVKLGADANDEATLQLAQDENHVFARIGPRLLIARKLTGNFPDYARVLPSGEDVHVALVDRAALLAAIARVSEFADETSQACRVQFAEGGLRVFASCVESGESEETVECAYAGPDLEIGFNASLRPEALGGAGEEYRYVMMPMRV